MKYPMHFEFKPELNYPYQFRFDLVDDGPMPMHQIPHIKETVNAWLKEAGFEYSYSSGLLWGLVHEQDAVLFQLRFA